MVNIVNKLRKSNRSGFVRPVVACGETRHGALLDISVLFVGTETASAVNRSETVCSSSTAAPS